jgi:putative ABC transport system permease protein
MLRNYLITVLRHAFLQKVHSFINVAGLSIGLTCSILILLWVEDEFSYDRYHENARNLYRIYEKQTYSGGEEFIVFATPEPLVKALRDEIPEIVNACRLNNLWEKLLVRNGDITLYESRTYAADQSALEMFSYDFIHGEKANALTQPYSIVLTESMAARYFGDTNPVGKILEVNNQYAFTVTGVMQDIPPNSHVTWECLVPFDFIIEMWDYETGMWGSNSFRTYIQTRDGISEAEVEEKIIDMIRKHKENSTIDLYLQPLTETHLHSIWGGGPIQYVRVFLLVAIFILAIACINFMNLVTARSAKRAKEVGIRKVAGAGKRSLVLQFYGESLFMTVLAVGIALILVELLIHPFNQLVGKELVIDRLAPDNTLALIGIVLITGIFSGSYPAQFLSSFKSIDVIKGIYRSGSPLFRKILVVIQFTISIALIICTLVVYRQLDFIRTKDLGFHNENLMYITFRDFSGYIPFKQALLDLPGVHHVTATNRVPVTMTNSSWGFDWEGKDPEDEILFQQIFVDFDYTETFGMEILNGRSFSVGFPADSFNFIINEETARRMAMDDPIGKWMTVGQNRGYIVGVVKDFNFHHLTRAIDPLILEIVPEYFKEVVISLHPDALQQTLRDIEMTWEKLYPGEPFEYTFLDEEFDEMYRAESRMGKVFNYFALLAIIISCLGLFGMASFMAEQRTKEIGIRKAHGSSNLNIYLLMNRSFVAWVLAANVIAWPVSWFLMNRWLDNYAYKTNVSWWIFLLAAGISLLIAVLTVTFQAIKAAGTNPAETLRYE